MKCSSILASLVTAFALTLLPALPAQAQLNGSHSLGDFGVQSGSQPQPGFNAAPFYYRYDTDTIKDADGNTVSLSPAAPGSLALTAVAPIAWYVSKAKVLGGNYGVMVVLPFANASLEAPAFQLDRGIDTGIADMLVRPLDLGWHTKQADVAAGFQLYVPTGRYEPGASDNLGKGMWSYEPFVGTTVYLDEKRSPESRRHRLLGVPRKERGQRRQGRPDPVAAGRRWASPTWEAGSSSARRTTHSGSSPPTSCASSCCPAVHSSPSTPATSIGSLPSART